TPSSRRVIGVQFGSPEHNHASNSVDDFEPQNLANGAVRRGVPTYPSELPNVSSYVDLIDRFIERDISAPDFEKSFLQAMKSERRTLGDPVYPILQELFEDADAYVEQAELRTEPEDLDDEQLLASALRARHALRGLGYE